MPDIVAHQRRAVLRHAGWICAAWAIVVAGAVRADAQQQERDPFDPPPPSSGEDQGVTVKRNQGESAPAQQEQDGGPGQAGQGDDGVSVSEYMTVDLHVHDEDLSNVLQMLSIQSERNIVMSSDVSATVSADLYDVTFFEALDAILNVNGYGYIERGNFIYVYTLEEIAQIEEAQRTPISKVIQLDYLNANDAAEFVTPLLSEVGQIKTNGDVEQFSIPDDTPTGDEQFALSATMVVFDYPEHVEEIKKLIDQLDTRPKQVLVEATILQTQLTEANAFGVDFSLLTDADFTDFVDTGGPLSVANSLIQGGSGGSGDSEDGSGGSGGSGDGFSPSDNQAIGATSTVGNTSGQAGFKVGIIQEDFSLFVRLLDEVSDTTIISNPKLLTLNRQPARVLVGERVGFLNTTSTETSTTQTVEFLDTGTQLRFRPFVSNDGFIRMELNPSVSEANIREASDSTGAGVTIPDEITQELTTNVLVNDGSTIVLGGLFKETTRINRRQVPVVGDLPLVGAAFRGHSDDIDRSEIIFLIRPTIVNDNVLLSQGERAEEYVDLVRTGTRSGLLPWSRDRMTSRLNLQAERLAHEGRTDRALWKIRRSLQLDSNQAEALKLRQRLVGEREIAPSRSLLNMIIDQEIEEQTKGMPKMQKKQDGEDGNGEARSEKPAEKPQQDEPRAEHESDERQAKSSSKVGPTTEASDSTDADADKVKKTSITSTPAPMPPNQSEEDLLLTATMTPANDETAPPKRSQTEQSQATSADATPNTGLDGAGDEATAQKVPKDPSAERASVKSARSQRSRMAQYPLEMWGVAGVPAEALDNPTESSGRTDADRKVAQRDEQTSQPQQQRSTEDEPRVTIAGVWGAIRDAAALDQIELESDDDAITEVDPKR